MKESKIHLVPPIIIDIAQNIATTKQENLRINYIMRLEAIREYCDEILKVADTHNHSLFDKKTKTQLNYSRTGRNNV